MRSRSTTLAGRQDPARAPVASVPAHRRSPAIGSASRRQSGGRGPAHGLSERPHAFDQRVLDRVFVRGGGKGVPPPPRVSPPVRTGKNPPPAPPPPPPLPAF